MCLWLPEEAVTGMTLYTLSEVLLLLWLTHKRKCESLTSLYNFSFSGVQRIQNIRNY